MQIVGYETSVRDGGSDESTAPPALLVADDGAVDRVSLAPGTTLSYGLGDRTCAGVVDGDGHTSCNHRSAPYCDQHSSVWACAVCRGNCGMPLDACHEEHAVYLAAFAPDSFKVGVTRSWRLQTRLTEQGADRAAHVHTVPDGKLARQLEAEYARDVPVPDRVRVEAKIPGFDRDVDADAWSALLAEFDPLETFEFDYDLSLDAAPVPETVASGTVRGVKGRVLVLDSLGTSYAVDLRDLVGYRLVDDEEREVQSSLGAFE